MKYLSTTIIIIFLFNVSYSQITNLDSIYLDSVLNNYDRRYRRVLNESDTIFIEKIIYQIKKTKNCDCLGNYFSGNSISAKIKINLVKQLIDNDLCYNQIWNYINIFHNDSDAISLLSLSNYPIKNLIINDTFYLNKVIDYILLSDYLNDCSYSIKYNYQHLKTISYLLSKNRKVNDFIVSNFNKMDKCKLANLILLTNSFKEAYIKEIDYNKFIIVPPGK